MPNVVLSPEELSKLDQINKLVGLLATRFSPQANPWWVAQMCPYLIAGDGFPLTGTEFGLLAGIEFEKGRHPATQPSVLIR